MTVYSFLFSLDRHDGEEVSPDNAVHGEVQDAGTQIDNTKVDDKPVEDEKPPRHVPVEELARERKRRQDAESKAKEAIDRVNALENDGKVTAREAAALRKQLDAFEDEKRSDLERAQVEAQRAKERAEAADMRVVNSEIRLAAQAAGFVRPEDAAVFLGASVKDFLGDVDVDSAGIAAAVAKLAEERPYMLTPKAPDVAEKPVVESKVKPDPSQGASGAVSEADGVKAMSSADFASMMMSQYGVRL